MNEFMKLSPYYLFRFKAGPIFNDAVDISKASLDIELKLASMRSGAS